MIIDFGNRGGGSVDIIDNLTSTRADAALSAKQGKVLNEKFDDYTPTEDFATINGSAITTGEEIVITGGDPDAEKVVELTQAQYDALTGYAQNTTYVITDAAAINMDNYAAASSITTLETSIASKADKQNITANENTSYYSSVARFPKWNTQGVITGNDGNNWGASWSYVNGSSKNIMAKDAATFSIYAPEGAGSNGQILKSSGSGAPSWANATTITGGLVMWSGTQAQYDAMATHDASTLYIITD